MRLIAQNVINKAINFLLGAFMSANVMQPTQLVAAILTPPSVSQDMPRETPICWEPSNEANGKTGAPRNPALTKSNVLETH